MFIGFKLTEDINVNTAMNLSNSMDGGNLLGRLSDYQLLKEYPAQLG
jgi:hypothetical protein